MNILGVSSLLVVIMLTSNFYICFILSIIFINNQVTGRINANLQPVKILVDKDKFLKRLNLTAVPDLQKMTLVLDGVLPLNTNPPEFGDLLNSKFYL